MTELKVGSVVVFARDNLVKKGNVRKIYEEFDMVVVDVPEDNHLYKVSLFDITVMSDTNDQEEPKNEGDFIKITPTEFEAVSSDLINSLQDTGLQSVLTLFSELLSRKLFDQISPK